MKHKNFIILLAAFVILLGSAFISYHVLSRKYEADNGSAANQSTIKAPDFTVLDRNGNPVKLSDYFGKPIVLNFWATWCGPCKSELPAFNALHAEYGEDVQFLMVNLTDGQRETVEVVEAFLTQYGYEFPVYFDTKYEASYAYSAYSIPLSIFIDKDGAIVQSYLGAMSEETLRSLIAEIR